MTAPWPLTGRSAQLEELGRHYRDPRRAGVVLHGPAGVGKTRLAEEALRLAERGGRRAERAVAHPATREIPLGALAHLMPADLTGQIGVGDDERTGLFHAARAELRRLAGDDRLVLLVDDIDLLDDTSVALLVPLVVARTVFLVGTVRTGRSPASELAVLHRDGHLVRMEIGPLDGDELGVLLHRALDGPITDAARRELARLSGGNLQVLTELVRGARERGVLQQIGGAWQLTGRLPTTAALDELVAEHLAGVAPEGRAVLELLAVCERFGLHDLERVYGDLLEGLERDGLIAVAVDGRRTYVRLSHPLYGDVLRAGLPPLRLRRIHAQLADMVETHGTRRREDVIRLAVWRVSSGGTVAVDHLQQATRLALAGHDPDLALHLLGSSGGDDVPLLDRVELQVEAHSMRGDRDAVERAVAAVWDRDDLADERRAHLAKRVAETRFYRGRDLDGALAAHEEARARCHDADVVAAIDARRASLLAGAGRPAEALRIADSIDRVTSTRARVELGAARATALLSLGRFDEAIATSRAAAADQAELRGSLARRGSAQHLVNEAHALAYSGRYAAARALLEPAAVRAEATGAAAAWVWFEMALAEVARDTGRGHDAVRRFRAVAAAAPIAGQHAALVWAEVGVAQGHLLLGECAEAAVALERAAQVDSPVATSVGTRERACAWLDACRGDLATARQRIRDAIVPVRADGVTVFEVALLHDLARFGVAAEAVDRLEELAAGIDGPLAATQAAHARALVERDVDAQRDVVDRFEEMDALGLAAEAAAELADLHRRRAEARAATAALQRATDLADRAGGLRTPVLARGRGIEPLTGREREVALLAARGRSSRDIAAHLGLSARTVDTHLARVYRKLGVGRRSELAAALGEPEPTTT
jgi:DNA-binding CsgD family transcriptional regulator